MLNSDILPIGDQLESAVAAEFLDPKKFLDALINFSYTEATLCAWQAWQLAHSLLADEEDLPR